MKTSRTPSRFFYVVYLKDGIASDCIEAIRFLSDPSVKLAAHITVRGPYAGKIDQTRIKEINKKLAENYISIIGAGNFFGPNQHTVFLRCIASDTLRKVWKKSDYSFNPHLTLYDGNSAEFSRKLYEVVSKYNYRLIFRADKLRAINSKKGQRSFYLPLVLNTKEISKIVGEQIEVSNVTTMPEQHRLFLINKLCQYLSCFSQSQEHLPFLVNKVKSSNLRSYIEALLRNTTLASLKKRIGRTTKIGSSLGVAESKSSLE